MSQTSSLDKCRRQQEDEISILESIYGTEFLDLRANSAWKVNRPPEVLITLFPQQGSSRTIENHVNVKLQVKCSAQYPLEKPEIFLKEPDGLSKDDIRNLKMKLEDLAKAEIGEVVIFKLAELVREFLYQRNLPPKKSFHEERLNNEAEKDRMRLEAEKEKRDEELQLERNKIREINEEFQRRRLKVKESRRKRSISQANRTVERDFYETNIEEEVNNVVDIEANIVRCNIPEHHTTEIIKISWLREQDNATSDDLSYRSLLCGSCIGDGCYSCEEKHHAVLHAVDQSNGQAVALVEWRFPLLLRKSVDSSLLASIEKDVGILCRLDHNHLAKYFGYKGFVEENEESDAPTVCIIQLVTEYIGGPSLATYIRRQQSLPLDYLRFIAGELLCALEYLHKRKLAHKSLRASSVLINSLGSVKVTDYNIERRLIELRDSCCKSNRRHSKPSKVTAKSLFKADIFQYGLLLLEAASGKENFSDVPEIDINFPSPFREFVEACWSKGDETILSIEQLKKHSFIFDDIKNIATKFHQESPEANPVIKNRQDSNEKENNFTVKASSEGSRIKSEFEILDSIGEGAFGKVFKARNQIDGRFYAIKQVSMDTRDSRFIKKITREVELLARLKHENIVRYYTSWFETVYEPDSSTSCSSEARTEPSVQFKKKEEESIGNMVGLNKVELEAPERNGASADWSDWGSDDEEGEENDSESSSEDEEQNVYDDNKQQYHEASDDFIQFESDSAAARSETNDSSVRHSEISMPSSAPLVARKYLNIQMELCVKSTLRRAIDEENLHLDSKRFWRLFREIVDGLAHIHAQQMIHRDLKPGNIFLDNEDHVKIGDFGLATTGKIVQTKEQNIQLLQMSDAAAGDISFAGLSSTQGVVGTFLYSAPEANKNKSEITQKFDIYSLGIIFVEMCFHLPTKMERAALLHQVRLSTIDLPDTIKPREIKLIKWLLHHNPEERPTSQEILKSDLLPPLELEVTAFMEKVRSSVSKPGSKLYKEIVESMFSQTVPYNDDYLYDCFPESKDSSVQLKTQSVLQIQSEIIRQFEIVFASHNAQNFSPPLLMPKGSDPIIDSQSQFLDTNGMIVMLPCEQRLPFARYLAKYGITWMKRYSFTRSYRNRLIYGFHPVENFECVFDIVGVDHLVPLQAEAICVLRKLIQNCSLINRRKFVLFVNNTKIFEGILRCFNIDEKAIPQFKKICHLNKNLKSRHKSFDALCREAHMRSDQQEQLEAMLNNSGTFEEIHNKLNQFCKGKQAYHQIKKNIHNLSEILKLITEIDKSPKVLDIRVSLDLVDSKDIYGGFIFQIVSSKFESQIGKKSGKVTLAVGGQYEHIIKRFILSTKESGVVDKRFAIGFTFNLDNLTNLHLQTKEQLSSGSDILICTNDKTDALKYCILLCDKLRLENVICDFRPLDELDLEELDQLCRHTNIPHLLVITAGGESGNQRNMTARLCTYDSKGQKSYLTEYITDLESFSGWLKSKLSAKSSNVLSSQIYSQPQMSVNHQYNRIQESDTSSAAARSEIIFVDKESKKSSKSHAAKIRSRLKFLLQDGSKMFLPILAADISDDVLTTFSSEMRFIKNEKQFSDAAASIEKRHCHFRNCIPKICDYLQQFKFQRQYPMAVLYSLKDATFAVIQLVN